MEWACWKQKGVNGTAVCDGRHVSPNPQHELIQNEAENPLVAHIYILKFMLHF